MTMALTLDGSCLAWVKDIIQAEQQMQSRLWGVCCCSFRVQKW